MSDQSLTRINSGRFADIQDCVKHWKTNDVALGNVTRRILFKGGFVMDEPHHIFYEYRELLLQGSTEIDLDPKFHRRPKAASEFIYGTPDLGYLILLANGMSHPKQFLGPKVRYVRPEKLGQILSIINRIKPELVARRANPTPVFDRTLVLIDTVS
jgi:hypothetical protein